MTAHRCCKRMTISSPEWTASRILSSRQPSFLTPESTATDKANAEEGVPFWRVQQDLPFSAFGHYL